LNKSHTYNPKLNSKFKIFFLSCITYIIALGNTEAQKKQPLTIGITFHRGFLYNHSPKSGVTGVSLTDVNGFEASFQWQTLGTKPWHQVYKFPQWGVSLLFLDMKQKRYSGQGTAFLIHKSIPCIRSNFFDLNFRMATGLGFFNQIYDANDNPNNLWISLPFSPTMQMQMEGKFKLTKHISLTLGGTFTHFSNGNLSQPNLGMNIPTYHVGIRYTPNTEKPVFIKDSTKIVYEKNYLHIGIAGGAKVLSNAMHSYYGVYNFHAYYGRRVSGMSKLLIGIDIFQDNSLNFETTNDELRTKPDRNIQRIGIYGGHEFLFGKMGFVVGLGYYLYNEYTDRDGNTYFRLGLRYNISPRFYSMVNLKSHLAVADNIEFAFGFNVFK
jgi:hypothetical protein